MPYTIDHTRIAGRKGAKTKKRQEVVDDMFIDLEEAFEHLANSRNPDDIARLSDMIAMATGSDDLQVYVRKDQVPALAQDPQGPGALPAQGQTATTLATVGGYIVVLDDNDMPAGGYLTAEDARADGFTFVVSNPDGTPKGLKRPPARPTVVAATGATNLPAFIDNLDRMVPVFKGKTPTSVPIRQAEADAEVVRVLDANGMVASYRKRGWREGEQKNSY
jgi:hypothetical protein